MWKTRLGNIQLRPKFGGNDGCSSSKRYTKVAHLGRIVYLTPNRESVPGRFL